LRRAARAGGGQLPVRWLLAEWPAGKPEPVKYWLANLPEDTPLQRLVWLASYAGESNTTIASSRTHSGWITSRAAPGGAGIIT
jgi:hypothetical protein